MSIDDLQSDINDMYNDMYESGAKLSETEMKELSSMEEIAEAYEIGDFDRCRELIEKHTTEFNYKYNII